MSKHTLENIALISQIGIAMLVPIIGGVYLGRWIDNRLNTQPIFLFVFILLGIAGSFSSLFKLALGKPGKRGK
ncbi:AtpZ/AtpI family protein [Alkaliphilus crotonatoxidans]